jgi:hypothetical protein
MHITSRVYNIILYVHAFLFCWHFSYRTCTFCIARSDWLQLPLAALHINRHCVTSKIRLTMPRAINTIVTDIVQYQDIQTALGQSVYPDSSFHISNYYISSSHLIWDHPFCNEKVVFLESDKLQALYYLSVSEIWPVFIALETRIWHIQYKCIEIFNQDHWRFP